MRGSFLLKLSACLLALTAATALAQAPATPSTDAEVVAAALKSLETATGAERLAAIDKLADHGSHSAAATETLAKLLADSDEATRIHAAKALGAIGPGAAAAVDPLIAALDVATPKVLAYELYALGRIGEKAQAALPKVAAQLTSEDPQVRREAVKAIRQMKLPLETTVPILMKVLESAKSSEELMPALHAMSEVGKPGVPRLIEAIQKYPQSSFWVCRILGEIGPDAAEAVPVVTEVLADDQTDVRREAVLCLGHIGKPAAAAAPKIVALLADKDAGIRAASVWALMMVDSSPSDILSGVKPLVADADPMVKLVASWSVAKLEPTNAEQRRAALDLFIASLKDANPRIRAAAARAIVDLKSGDEAAREALIGVLADGDPTVSMVVGRSLIEGGEESVPMLIKGLGREDIRGFAAQTLAQLGPKGKAAVGALTTALADENPHVRAIVLVALGSVAPDDADVTAKLIAALSDKNPDVRLAAVESLIRNKAAVVAAKPELEKLLMDPSPAVREAARFALEAHKAE